MNDLIQLSTQQLVVLGALIAGVTELLNRLRAKDWWVVASIVSAGLVGGLAGLYFKVDFVTGVVAGLSVSGVLKTVSVFGQKSTPTESTVLGK